VTALPPLPLTVRHTEGVMVKPRQRRARQSAEQTSATDSQPYDAPTWPRLDLVPPEHALRMLRDWGRVILVSGYLNAADRVVVERAVQQLHEAAATGANDPISVAAVACAAYVIGAHGGMTDTARRFFEKSQATLMRVQRATSSREQELRTAIEAAIKTIGGTIPSTHPYKDAEAISDSVNARLSQCRMKAASVDAIARRLQPRSSRTRKK
jgi:hypothetical protein